LHRPRHLAPIWPLRRKLLSNALIGKVKQYFIWTVIQAVSIGRRNTRRKSQVQEFQRLRIIRVGFRASRLGRTRFALLIAAILSHFLYSMMKTHQKIAKIYSDIPPLDKSFLKRATTAWPPVKKQLTIRLDTDVLAWLKAQGRGYQTRINRILRVVMESQPPAPFGDIRSRRLPPRETSKPGKALGANRARAQ
jgi:uncharacterized protein (DUF4415 family)